MKSITGETTFSAFNLENLRVRVYGDSAVVTAITAKTGDKDESGRYTFVKQNGEWKAVSGQATVVAKP